MFLGAWSEDRKHFDDSGACGEGPLRSVGHIELVNDEGVDGVAARTLKLVELRVGNIVDVEANTAAGTVENERRIGGRLGLLRNNAEAIAADHLPGLAGHASDGLFNFRACQSLVLRSGWETMNASQRRLAEPVRRNRRMKKNRSLERTGAARGREVSTSGNKPRGIESDRASPVADSIKGQDRN